MKATSPTAARRAEARAGHRVEVQLATRAAGVPPAAELRRWADAALQRPSEFAELVVRVVGRREGAQLNERYRGRPGATNVLSFPFEAPPGMESRCLGDVVICAPVVQREARAQGKAQEAHWAHMVVHGVLHLRGYDHRTESEAGEMERLETEILAGLGYGNPY